MHFIRQSKFWFRVALLHLNAVIQTESQKKRLILISVEKREKNLMTWLYKWWSGKVARSLPWWMYLMWTMCCSISTPFSVQLLDTIYWTRRTGRRRPASMCSSLWSFLLQIGLPCGPIMHYIFCVGIKGYLQAYCT